MLTLPQETKESACVLGIDPGSQFLGVAVIEYDITTGAIISSSSQTFQADKLEHKAKWVITLHGDRIARILAHKRNLIEVFNEYQPVRIACESPFYNPRRPNAYGALMEVLSAIRMAVIEWSQWVGLDLIDPPTVKKAIGAGGAAKKEEMMVKMLLKSDELKHSKEISSLDEHSIDALAVAYHCYKQTIKEMSTKA